jgi:CMP-N-acetylneuraminic acid synthetase
MSTGHTVALLPMKAHSARVKSKNFRDLVGKPLYAWILDTLIGMDQIDQIVINTDARDILTDSGLTDGGKVMIRDRKPEICGDFVSMDLVLADDLAAVEAAVEADTYVMTHTTNPLLSATTIGGALEDYRVAHAKGETDSLFTVNKTQTRFYRKAGSAVNHDSGNLIRTQDLEPWFEGNSGLYLFSADSFAKTKACIGAKPMMFETPMLEAVDIDDAPRWFMAESLARRVAAGENLGDIV